MATQSSELSQFAAVIGLDWSDRKHDVCVQCAGQRRREVSVIEHSVEAIDVWAQGLRERFEGRCVAIALELEQGPIVSALRKYDFIVLFPINPASLSKYREVFTHSGAKDDPSDAGLALEFLLKHPEELQPLNPQSPQMRALDQLVQMRRRLVDDQTRITNRLTSALKNYFPQVLQWFEHKDTLMFCDFLQRWPTLKCLRQARRATLERFFHEHNVRRPALIAQRIDAMKAARPLTDDEGVIVPFSLLVNALVEQLRVTIQAVESFDREIAARAQRIPTFGSLTACRRRDPCLHRACSPPSASNASDIQTPMTCSAMQASLRSPNAAATPIGSIGDGVVRRSCGKPLSSGRP